VADLNPQQFDDAEPAPTPTYRKGHTVTAGDHTFRVTQITKRGTIMASYRNNKTGAKGTPMNMGSAEDFTEMLNRRRG
jgi:hypothetical protein